MSDVVVVRDGNGLTYLLFAAAGLALWWLWNRDENGGGGIHWPRVPDMSKPPNDPLGNPFRFLDPAPPSDKPQGTRFRRKPSSPSSSAPPLIDVEFPGTPIPREWPETSKPQKIPRSTPFQVSISPQGWIEFPPKDAAFDPYRNKIVANRLTEVAAQLDVPVSIATADVGKALSQLTPWQMLSVYERAADLPKDFPVRPADAAGRFWFLGVPVGNVTADRPKSFTTIWLRRTYVT